MLLGSQSLVASLQHQYHKLAAVVLDAAASLSARFRMSWNLNRARAHRALTKENNQREIKASTLA